MAPNYPFENAVRDFYQSGAQALSDLGLSREGARNATLFFPRLTEPYPKRDGQFDVLAPYGVIADANRGRNAVCTFIAGTS